MSTTPIAQPLAALNANPAPARSNAAAAQPAVQFGQTLSREIAQRQAMQQQPAAPVNARAGAPRPAEKAPAPAARPEQGAKAEQAAAPVPDAAPARPAAPANNTSRHKRPPRRPPPIRPGARWAPAAPPPLPWPTRTRRPTPRWPPSPRPPWPPPAACRRSTGPLPRPPPARWACRPNLPWRPNPGPPRPATCAPCWKAPMPRAAGAATESAQGQAAPTQTGALQTAAVPADAARLAPAARELPESVGAIDLKAAEPAPVAAPLQQAALGLAQAANAGADKLSARVGTPAWDNQVGQKIVWMVAGKEQSATLTLNPPDLGPVQVVLNVTGDNASVTFSSGELEVRQALENAMPKLREMMDESGISLGNASVNAGMPEQRQDQGERATAASADGSGAGGGRGIVNGSAADANERLAARTPAQGGALGLVDTFA
ncbi:flagellar hook-length control protein FliK [Massilia atriviolacea]|uniref:flagellar hook-length control protein FliK n=1 Tax=Massilia atriviolacea TaxID=2495579 RepID=UPI003857CC20